MRPNSKLFAAAIFGLLAGCNQPAVTLKAPASQSSENTVRDWNDVGDQIASSLMTSGLLAAPPEPGTITNLPIRPVFIHQQAPRTRPLYSRLPLDWNPTSWIPGWTSRRLRSARRW